MTSLQGELQSAEISASAPLDSRTSPPVTYTPYVSRNQILTFPPELTFRIYYLEAPLSALGDTFGRNLANNLVSINGFHTSVGFQSTDKSLANEFTLGLDLENGFAISSFVPEIVTKAGVDDLVWNDLTQINLGSYIDRTYWESSSYIGTVTSTQVLQIQNWIFDDWIPKNPIYSIASGIKSTDSEDIFNPIFRPSLCDTFCYSIYNFIQH